jgi:hypothetical protein
VILVSILSREMLKKADNRLAHESVPWVLWQETTSSTPSEPWLKIASVLRERLRRRADKLLRHGSDDVQTFRIYDIMERGRGRRETASIPSPCLRNNCGDTSSMCLNGAFGFAWKNDWYAARLDRLYHDCAEIVRESI